MSRIVSFRRMPLDTYRDEGFCSVVPDLVVEVISPNDLAYEVEAKTDEWLASQVGRDRSLITKIKNGKGRPSLTVAVAIEKATGGQVPPSSLMAEAR